MSMRNLPYRGDRVSFFWYQGTLHTTHAASSPLPQVVYTHDVSDEVVFELGGGLAVTALERDVGVTMLLASTAGFEGAVHFRGKQYNMHLSAGGATLIEWSRGAAKTAEVTDS
jgi:hypothetical protein